jgi:transposase
MDAEFSESECPNCRLLRRRVAELEAQVARLSAQVEKLTAALEAAQRAGKRQAAPFRKSAGPKPDPKMPGRKSGEEHGCHAHRPAPEKIDERYDVPLPEKCPHCGGRHLHETRVEQQYQTEIPRQPIHRQFDIHLGQCRDCGRTVQPRHPLQTSHALGAAASQLGADAHAAFVLLNKQLGLSHGKCAKLFQVLFGIRIARATSVRSLTRTAQQTTPAYDQLRRGFRRARWVVADETGWRVGGASAWLHAFISPSASCYVIDPTRSHQPLADLLGTGWRGTLIHDGWAPYDQFPRAWHQQCLAHLQRRCQGLLESAQGMAARLPRQVLDLIMQAYDVRRRWRAGKLTEDQQIDAGLTLACYLEDAAGGRFTCAANRRLAKHILAHSLHWFWFLIDPAIDATNWRAEQALRPAVVNRKVWGGNRTWLGAHIQAALTSLAVTLTQRGQDLLAWFAHARRALTPLALHKAGR